MTAGNWKHLNAPIKSMSALFVESVCLPDIKMEWNKSPMKFYQAANSRVSYLQPAKRLISLRCRHHHSHPDLCYPYTLFWSGKPRHPRGPEYSCLGRQTNGRIKHLYSKPEDVDRQQAGQSCRCSLPKWVDFPGHWKYLQFELPFWKADFRDSKSSEVFGSNQCLLLESILARHHPQPKLL